MIKYQCKTCGRTYRAMRFRESCLLCRSKVLASKPDAVEVEIGKPRIQCQKCGKFSEHTKLFAWDKYRLLVPLCETCAVPQAE